MGSTRGLLTIDIRADLAYHDWLVSLVDSPDGDLARYYTALCDCMDEIEFIPAHPWDENRIADSLKRRQYFLENVYKGPIGAEIDRKYVSFFEVIVGIFVDLSEKSFTWPGDPSVAPDMMVDFLGEIGFLRLDNEHFDRNFCVTFCVTFLKKSKKLHIFGQNLDKDLDFWAIFSTIFGKKYS